MSERIPQGFAELHFQYRLEGDPEPMFNTLGLQVGAGFEIDDAIAARDEWSTAVADSITPQYTLGPGFVVVGTDPEDAVYPLPGPTTTGNFGGDSLPQNCAILVRKRGNGAGRRSNGRMYLPGPPEGQVSNTGTLVPSFATDLFDRLSTFRDNVINDDSIENIVLFHNSPPWDPTVIGVLQVSPLIATQRTRLRR